MDNSQNIIIEKIKEILRKKKEILFAFLFGSSLKSENPNDIDIGVFVKEKDIDEESAFDYSLSLSSELSYELDRELDVSIMNYASLGLLKNIIQGELLFAQNQQFVEDYIERKSFEYMEYYELSKFFLRDVLIDRY
jgi:predicted nucleotidyltransferase